MSEDKQTEGPPSMRRLVAELHRRRQEVRLMGGPEKIQEQHDAGKLTARERIGILLDEQAFHEIGAHASSPAVDGSRSPADGVVTGLGSIDGRPVAVAAWDFTVRGGTLGAAAHRKLMRLCDVVERRHVPIVWLLDSLGPRTGASRGEDQVGAIAAFADSGSLIRAQSRLSGRTPQIAAVMGPARAEAAWIAGLSDYVLMVRGTSSLTLGGPNLVRAAIGEKVTEQGLGGSQVHAQESGIADCEYDSEEACLIGIRALLGHLGSPVVHAEQEEGPTADLLPDSVLDLMPADRTGPWDVRALIRQIVDPPLEGQAINLFELKPDRAPNVITALGRIAGRSVGIVANNPQVMSGVIDVGAAQKMTRFIERCSNFSIPLVFLADTPGFLIGSEAERQGILAHGAALLRVVAEARVLRLTVVLRRAYGAGYYAMCGRAFEPGLLVAWPTAEISVLAPEGIVSIAMARRIDNAHDPDAERVRLAEAIRPQFDIFHAAERGFVDDVIDPRETRRVLLRALAG